MSPQPPGHPWARFTRAMAHREPATPLALFRIAVASIVLLSLLHMALTDVIEPILFGLDHGGVLPLKPSSPLWALLGRRATPELVLPLFWGTVAGSAALAVGLGGRLTALLVLQGCIALFAINGAAGGGHDKLLTNALWLLVLAPSTATLSLDARLRTGSWVSDRPVAAWARYLAIVQICLVYGTTGIQKLGAEWMPWGGWSALYYSLLLPSWARFDMTWIAWVYPLTQAATAATWLWEATFPLLLVCFWHRATRTRGGRLRQLSNRLDLRSAYVLMGVFVHVGIWATMNVGPFSWASLAYYLCLYHHDEWARLGRRLRGASSALAPSPDAAPGAPAPG